MAKKNLLVLDADARSRRMLETSLRKAGFSVTMTTRNSEALEMAELSPPDLIISDTKGPEIHGFEFCEAIKNNPKTHDIPFIFLTVQDAIEHKVKGLELGVDDYLTKPIYMKEVITRVRILLEKREKELLQRRDRSGLGGSLGDMGVVDLLQTIEMGRKTGILNLDNGRAKGRIFFTSGKVVDAELGQLQGEKAVYRFLVWNDGAFSLEFEEHERSDNISLSTQGLLMEGMRRVDEWGRLLEQLPPLESCFDIDYNEFATRLAEIPDEVNSILRLFDGQRSLMEIVDISDYGDLETLNTISKLYFEGLIREDGSGDENPARAIDKLSSWLDSPTFAADAVEPEQDEEDQPSPTPEAPQDDEAEGKPSPTTPEPGPEPESTTAAQKSTTPEVAASSDAISADDALAKEPAAQEDADSHDAMALPSTATETGEPTSDDDSKTEPAAPQKKQTAPDPEPDDTRLGVREEAKLENWLDTFQPDSPDLNQTAAEVEPETDSAASASAINEGDEDEDEDFGQTITEDAILGSDGPAALDSDTSKADNKPSKPQAEILEELPTRDERSLEQALEQEFQLEAPQPETSETKEAAEKPTLELAGAEDLADVEAADDSLAAALSQQLMSTAADPEAQTARESEDLPQAPASKNDDATAEPQDDAIKIDPEFGRSGNTLPQFPMGPVADAIQSQNTDSIADQIPAAGVDEASNEPEQILTAEPPVEEDSPKAPAASPEQPDREAADTETELPRAEPSEDDAAAPEQAAHSSTTEGQSSPELATEAADDEDQVLQQILSNDNEAAFFAAEDAEEYNSARSLSTPSFDNSTLPPLLPTAPPAPAETPQKSSAVPRIALLAVMFVVGAGLSAWIFAPEKISAWFGPAAANPAGQDAAALAAQADASTMRANAAVDASQASSPDSAAAPQADASAPKAQSPDAAATPDSATPAAQAPQNKVAAAKTNPEAKPATKPEPKAHAKPAPKPKPKPAANNGETFAASIKRGRALADRGRLRPAIAAYQKALAIKPKSAPALTALANAYFELDDLAKAERSLNKAVGIKPNYAPAWVLLGTVRQSRGNDKGALEAYRRYLSLAPTGPFAKDVREVVQRLSGR